MSNDATPTGGEQQEIRTDGGPPFSGFDGERPDDKDENEIFDLLLFDGPIEFEQLMKQISTYSTDEVMTHLESLERQGFVVQREVETTHEFESTTVTQTNKMWDVADGEAV